MVGIYEHSEYRAVSHVKVREEIAAELVLQPATITMADHLADKIVRYFDDFVGTVKLQKLLYYANGWSLGKFDRPIYSNRIEAWKHGPVVVDIYRKHARMAHVSPEWSQGDARRLTREDAYVADAVLDVYGGLSDWALRDLTHKEAPWRDAWAAARYGEVRGQEVTLDSIRSYFREQLNS